MSSEDVEHLENPVINLEGDSDFDFRDKAFPNAQKFYNALIKFPL